MSSRLNLNHHAIPRHHVIPRHDVIPRRHVMVCQPVNLDALNAPETLLLDTRILTTLSNP